MKAFKDIDTYKQGKSHDKFHVFGKELDVYLKVFALLGRRSRVC